MSAIISQNDLSRKALSLMGLAAAFGLAAAPTVLTVSDAAAQTTAAPTPASGGSQARRMARTERRQMRVQRATERRQGAAHRYNYQRLRYNYRHS